MEGLKPNPSYGQFAHFAAMAWRFGLIDVDSVVNWGDDLITETEYPAEWMIDLAFATDVTLCDLLRRVPGNPEIDVMQGQVSGTQHDETPEFLVSALLCRRWKAGNVNIGTVRSAGWFLYTQAQSSSFDWGVRVECCCEEMEQGWQTYADVEAQIAEELDEFAAIDPQLPSWVR